jgi:hypothetical protein
VYKTISINIYCAWYNTIFFIFFYFSISKALSDAIKGKSPTYLQNAIQDAKKSPFTAELEEDIKQAEIFLAKLNMMAVIKQIYHVWEGHLRKIPVLRLNFPRHSTREICRLSTGIEQTDRRQRYYIPSQLRWRGDNN